MQNAKIMFKSKLGLKEPFKQGLWLGPELHTFFSLNYNMCIEFLIYDVQTGHFRVWNQNITLEVRVKHIEQNLEM